MISSNYLSLILVLLFNQIKLESVLSFWISDENIWTVQTSNVTLVSSHNNLGPFLLCDDVNDVYSLTFSNTKIYHEKLEFTKDLKFNHSSSLKKNFEGIFFDKYFNELFVSIEGNGFDFRDEVGAYRLTFDDNYVNSSELINISKLNSKGWKRISQYIQQKIGFEGLARSKNKYFFDLEGYQSGSLFLNLTILHFIDKNSMKLIKEKSTRELNIHIITGLYSNDDYHISGVDRNYQNIFEIIFNPDYTIYEYKIHKMFLRVSKLNAYKYPASKESIFLDDMSYIYLIGVIWKKFCIPSNDILKKLLAGDREDLKEFVPLII